MLKQNLYIFRSNSISKLFLNFIITILLIAILLSLYLPAYSDHYNGIVHDKLQYLDSIEGSRIILVGDSNLCFGVDSTRIENAFNIPVVNLGYHGGAGNYYNERLVYGKLHEGDVVVLCNSQYNASNDYGNPLLLWSTFDAYPSMWSIPHPKQWMELIDAYPAYLNKAITRAIDGSDVWFTYSKAAFNEKGDNIALREYDGSSDYIDWENIKSISTVSDSTVDRLNQYNKYINDNGATLLVAGYPIGYGEYSVSKEECDRFTQDISDKLDCEVISDFSEYMLPYSLFYDTDLHLTSEGAQIRTDLLIDDLKKWFANR